LFDLNKYGFAPLSLLQEDKDAKGHARVAIYFKQVKRYKVASITCHEGCFSCEKFGYPTILSIGCAVLEKYKPICQDTLVLAVLRAPVGVGGAPSAEVAGG